MNARELRAFVGEVPARLVVGGAALGVVLFGVDAAFAMLLQVFFVKVGVMGTGALHLPPWMPDMPGRWTMAVLAAFGALRGLLYGLQAFMQGATQEEFVTLQRRRVLEWTFTSPSASTAEVTSLFNLRAVYAGTAVYNLQAAAVQATLAVLLGAGLLVLAPKLTVFVAAALTLLVVPLRWADRRIKSAGDGLKREWDRTNERLVVSIKNLLLLQIHGTQREEEGRAQQSLSATLAHALSYYRLTGLKTGLPQFYGVLTVAAVAALTVRVAGLPAGFLLSYLYLVLRFVQTVAQASQAYSTYLLNRPQLDGLRDWWREHWAERAPAAAEAPAEPLAAPFGWRLDGVAFGYPGSAPLFQGLSLDVPPGGTLVVQGPSGAGKSTLLSLLLGGLAPSAGSVSVRLPDGSERPLAELRGRVLKSLGYVGPETFLVEGTVLKNLRYGLDREPTGAELEEALSLAECGFLKSLPGGLSHALSEQGQGLSAGQKQRLALARALLRRPTALILDEATANLDHDTEERLVATLERLKGRMTLVAVTHRKPLTRLADRLLTLGEEA